MSGGRDWNNGKHDVLIKMKNSASLDLVEGNKNVYDWILKGCRNVQCFHVYSTTQAYILADGDITGDESTK